MTLPGPSTTIPSQLDVKHKVFIELVTDVIQEYASVNRVDPNCVADMTTLLMHMTIALVAGLAEGQSNLMKSTVITVLQQMSKKFAEKSAEQQRKLLRQIIDNTTGQGNVDG